MNRREFMNSTLAGGTSIVGMQEDDLKGIIEDCLVMDKKYLVYGLHSIITKRSFACVGSGIIDFPDLFSYREPGIGNERACAQSSIDYLKSLSF